MAVSSEEVLQRLEMSVDHKQLLFAFIIKHCWVTTDSYKNVLGILEKSWILL